MAGSGEERPRRQSGESDGRRIACYGLVDADAGTGVSANYLLLRELTRRGVNVDLFALRGHIPFPIGLSEKHFRYLGFSPPFAERLLRPLPERVSAVLGRLASPVLDRAWHRICGSTAESIHRETPYHVVLALLTTSRVEIRGVPTVTLLQGPLSGELDAIRRLRRQITATSGWPFYLALVGLYRYALPFRRRALKSSARIIVGSEWSRKTLATEGFDPERIDVVPFAVDLDLFSPPGKPPPLGARQELLALGRLDPRKRLDLLLEAFRLVLPEYPEATLRIVGRPGYAPRQLSLIRRSPVRDRVVYQPPVPRERVPSLLRRSAVLIQTSENENFGSSVAEALACGTPVVVGPSNGTGQYLDHNSQVFEGYTPQAVARSLVRALRVRERRPEDVLRTTRAAAERWFSPPRVADQVMAVVDEAIATGAPAAGTRHLGSPL